MQLFGPNQHRQFWCAWFALTWSSTLKRAARRTYICAHNMNSTWPRVWLKLLQVPTTINASDVYDTNKDGILDADEQVDTHTQHTQEG